MSHYFLGVDGGQSSTVAVIGDAEGKIAGWASAGPCSVQASLPGNRGFAPRALG